jgi:hypothetical protein
MASNDEFCLNRGYLDARGDAGRHSMCEKKHLSQFNFNNVKYNVQVLKSGDQDKINKLVIWYEKKKSIFTEDETDLGIKL